MFGLSWLRRRKMTTAIPRMSVSRETHLCDEKSMRADGYTIISTDSLITKNGVFYIKPDVQQMLIDQAVRDTRARLTEELKLPITPGTKLRSIHEIKVSK